MKKKIAICANGWNYDSLATALEGIKQFAKEKDFDIFTFLSFASYSEFVTLMQGELNIYSMMDPASYDGVIVFSSSLNSQETAVSVCLRAKQAHVPVVSIGMDIEGIHSICVSNDEGMRALVTHLVEVHDVKDVVFIGGTPDHVDSIVRLEVTRAVLKEHGLDLPDENVKYGKWSNRYTAEVISEICDSKRGLPDAFVCANDIMALAACTELERRGYDVPGSVFVTGFDSIKEGKFFYPALTSVKQNYEKIGFRACEILFEEIAGDRETKVEIAPSSFVCGESCGCKGDEDFEACRMAYCRHSFQRNTSAKLLEQNERVMRNWLSDMPSYKVMKETLEDHYLNSHQFEGDGFYIVVDAEYYEDVMISEQELWARHLRKGCEVLIALKNGEIRNDLPVNSELIVPGYEKIEGEQHIYFMLPLHYFEANYGYLVLTDSPYIMEEDMLYPYIEKLQQSLRLMRTNLRLKSLYDKDQMTGLFNRFGYEDKAVAIFEDSLSRKAELMVMFVDINYMKRINDEFGHLHGDNAIKTVVASINDTIQNEGIAVRFGGDEFLIIVPDCDEARAAGMKQSIIDYLGHKNDEDTAPYKISVSIGYVVTNPEGRPNAVLQDYIREADKLMYDIKKEMHTKDRRQR
ncbi:MAG: diguanylate cyclase [Lachnospiraceae bacterium]|nr:diguanylate cyclase [Lachnospiraceae bacterium]